MTSEPEIRVRVRQIRYEADAVLSYELVALEGALPAFKAGAHVDVRVADDLWRSYSLLNDEGDRDRYVVAVHRTPDSRGGSAGIHAGFHAGDVVTIRAPRNHFPLDETAAHTVLVAGGIGVTPLLSMARRLEALGRSWEIYYAARTREQAAFLDDLAALASDRVHAVLDGGRPEAMLDIAAMVGEKAAGTHFYCCGPVGMLKAFEAATAGLPKGVVHVEYFSGAEEAALDGGYSVVLAKSGKTLDIPAGRSILDVLLENNVDVSFACTDGVCGTCKTTVLAGEPDHRDSFLTDEEKASNSTMMVCCSGSRSKSLTLDL